MQSFVVAFGKMVTEAQGQGQDGVGWVREAGAGKDGRAADVGVGEAVEAEVGVDDAGGVRGGHAHAAHVVVAVVAAGEEVGTAGHQVFVWDDASYVGEGALGDEDILPDGVQFPLGYLPVEADAEEAEGIALVGEGDAAARGGLLLAVDAEEDADFGGAVGAALDFVAPGLVDEHGEVLCGVLEVVAGYFAEAGAHEVADCGFRLAADFSCVLEGHGGADVECVMCGL